ncbi:MAG: hypothetical protein OQL19_06455 [Gammaproteobacteria bacterium]|nr:hypothetical protein [Gammaproteobacteria bacterium]
MILKIIFLLIVSTIIGCKSIIHQENPVIQDISRLSCSISELDKFMAFSNSFSSLPDKEKKIECDQLRFNYSVLNDWSSGWALAYAINEYPGCGKIDDGIKILKKIHNIKMNSKQIEWLINYQITLLTQRKTIGILKNQKHQLKQELKISNEELSNCQNEKKSMVLKIQELKSIETSINQRLEEK